jgi:hypothetical protein
MVEIKERKVESWQGGTSALGSFEAEVQVQWVA